VPTTGRALIRLRILTSDAATYHGTEHSSDCLFAAGLALDGRNGSAIAVCLGVNGNRHLGRISKLDHGMHQYCRSQDLGQVTPLPSMGFSTGCELMLDIERRQLRISWAGGEPTLLNEVLPDRVRPWVGMSHLRAAVELVSIRKQGVTGAAHAFLMLFSRRGYDLPQELRQKIWNYAVS